MAKPKRNIGLEILEGLREIKRCEHGRVTTVPSLQKIREKTQVLILPPAISCKAAWRL